MNRKYVESQMAQAQMFALYWHAMAMTGLATKRTLSKGRKPTPEEEAQGVVGTQWEPLTDEEKTKEALDTMHRHIHRHIELSEMLAEADEP